MESAPLFLPRSSSPCHPFLIDKYAFPLFDTSSSSFLYWLSLPGAGLLHFSPLPLPPPFSFLPSSFPSLQSFSPTLHFRLTPSNSSSRFSTHTKGSVSLYCTPPLAQPPKQPHSIISVCFLPAGASSHVKQPHQSAGEAKATSDSGR